MKRASTVVAIILLLAAIYPFYLVRGRLIENERPKVETIEAYPEPEFAKIVFMGLNAFAADLLFTRSQYYYGSHYVTDRTYPLLAQMTRVIMALNPNLDFVIPFAESAISSMRTEEAIEMANSLLRLGHELFPEDYYYVFNQGYNYYVYLDDMERAYPLMYEGARMKGAPPNVFWLVSRIATLGGGYRLGYEYTKERLAVAKDENMKDQLNKELRHFANLVILTEATDKYIKKYKKSPDKELKSLISSGILKEIPEGVFGGQYFYDEEFSMVKTSSGGYWGYEKEQKLKESKQTEKEQKQEEPKQIEKEQKQEEVKN